MIFERIKYAAQLLLVASLVFGCSNKIRPFPLEDPMWLDEEDMTSFSPMPEEYFSPFAWDGIDNMLFRPFARVFAVESADEAPNVNSMDEVPDSSWFTNRLSRRRYSVEEVIKGPCGDDPPLDPAGPWTVTSAKPDGANPGFIMKDQLGRRFVLKFDSPSQPERAVGADAMGTLIYWAAGFYTPCNRVVFFDRSILRVGEGATKKRAGKEIPLTVDDLDPIFEKAYRRKDGLWRAASSAFLPGKPLGPWRYEGTREDDPNDIIPHQERRELRGAYILAAWINHFDSREQNTLAMWIEDEETGKGYVRHNYIDFGDSFGSAWLSPAGIGKQFGHAAYLDMPHLLEDFVTLGAIPRKWRKAEEGPAGRALGYFRVEHFEPDKYRPGYPNPAMLRATERDRAWMTRILADITPEMVEAIVEQGQFEHRIVHTELVRILLGRREKLLRRYLGKLSPLTHPRLHQGPDGTEVCVRDLGVFADLVKASDRLYWRRGWRITKRRRLKDVEVGPVRRRGDHQVCAALPSVAGASADAPEYLIVDINALYGPDDKDSNPVRVYLYQLGERDYKIVGLGRPESRAAPTRPD